MTGGTTVPRPRSEDNAESPSAPSSPSSLPGSRRLLAALAALLVVAIAAVLVFQWWPPEPASPPPPGGFAFAALGDSQYYVWEELQHHRLVRQLEASDLAFVVHVGDIFWRPCSRQRYRSRLETFEEIAHPVIYTPGDNEWADCHERVAGSYPPAGRLAQLRELFFADPSRSLGRERIALVSQGAAPGSSFPELLENARWEHDGVVFATVHLVGSGNASRTFPGRTSEDDLEARRRTEGAASWTREVFAVARDRPARAVVLAFHAAPPFEEDPEDPERVPFEPFLDTLVQEAASFDRPVLIVHGDDHELIVDRPLLDPNNGESLGNVTRLEVPGSPRVGWVRVGVAPSGPDPFSFEPHVVPRWRFW